MLLRELMLSLIYSWIRSVDRIILIFGFSGRKLELESAALTLLSLISGASLTVREVALHKRSSPTRVPAAEGVSKKCERSVIRRVNSLIKGGAINLVIDKLHLVL